MPKPMRFSALFAALLMVAAAGAQTYPGEDVSVDYSATGTKVLLYPGGKYGRIVHPLRQPGEFTGPVKLHKPGKARTAATKPPPEAKPVVVHQASAPPLRREAAAPPAAPPAPPAKKKPPRQIADVSPPPPIRSEPQAPPARQTPPSPAKPKPEPVRTASITPPPQKEPAVAGDVRGTVGFESSASDPSNAAVQKIGHIAEDINDALLRGSARVQLLAYAGPKGEKSSNARRLSLKRALIVRQLLIDAGVPSDRIDVRAMGGATDSGAADRVDVLVKG